MSQTPDRARSLLRSAAVPLLWLGVAGASSPPSTASTGMHDILVRDGLIVDGSSGKPYVGSVVIDGDTISYVGPRTGFAARKIIDAKGKAVAPGFINMLSQAQESLLADGRGESDLVQGVTLEVLGEGESMGPWNDGMAKAAQDQEGDVRYPVTWRTLDQYLDTLEHRGISPNVTAVVGAATVRQNVLGEDDVQPTPAQLAQMQALTRQAMQEGAVAVGSALIYPPGSYAHRDELTALAKTAAECGGIYISHMRSEGQTFLEAVDETISIARQSGAPAEIYHLKAAGRANWDKLPEAIKRIDAARASGVRITADMYPYTAAATGLDASMPRWVMVGGLDAWIARLKDPTTRARLLAEMRNPPAGYESALVGAGADGTLLLSFKNEALKPYTGKTLAEVARIRGKSPEETALDMIIEDHSRIGVAYFLMSEDNLRREVVLPWMSFGSDGEAIAPEGAFLQSAAHPRAYGTFATVLGKYVRDEKLVSLQDAVRRLSAMPAANLALRDRGMLKAGFHADVVVFDPETIQPHSSYQRPHQLATGVSDVLVNGQFALADGRATGAHSGQVVRGRAWTGWKGGGCRASARDWSWVS